MLNNIIKKLKEDKKATIVYLGGSVTNGFGSTNANEFSWRALSGKHLKKNFPDAEINLINAGVGGTGTGYGRFRLVNDVLYHNPDLVFIEFSINDSYEGYNAETSYLYYESLLHTIHNFNDEIDIIMVVITDRGNMRNGPTSIAKAHYEIAERYGLPVIDILSAVAEDMKVNNREEDYYLKDWAHPNDDGYAFYASVVNKFIDENIVSASFGEIKKHTVPAPKMDNLLLGDTVMVDYDKFEPLKTEGFGVRDISENNVWFMSENAGDSFEFEFTGTHFSAWMRYGGENGAEGGAEEIECYLDGEYISTISMKSWSSATIHRTFFNGVENKKHHVKVVNKSGGLCLIKKFFFA